jgi:hypothetical protein
MATVANKIVERDGDKMNDEQNQTVLEIIYTCVKHKPEAMKRMEWDSERIYRRKIMRVENKKW